MVTSREDVEGARAAQQMHANPPLVSAISPVSSGTHPFTCPGLIAHIAVHNIQEIATTAIQVS
jgi:hypothetical protein